MLFTRIFLVLSVFFASSHAQRLLHFTRWVVPDTIWQEGSGQQPETTTVNLRATTTGGVDTLSTHPPLDLVLSFDLSGSMDATSGSPSRTRITWAQISARRFLDSLKSGDRTAIMGWTSSGDPQTMADTSNTSMYHRHWFGLSSDIQAAIKYIGVGLFLDGSRAVDFVAPDSLVWRNDIPGGNFTSTPLNSSTIVALRYLATHGDSTRGKAVILLTDGDNKDGISDAFTYNFIDSMFSTYGIQLFTIGFNGGDTTHLKNMASHGGGRFYNASNPTELDSVYAAIGRAILINQTVATELDTIGHKTPMIYDVLPDYFHFVPGSFREVGALGATATSAAVGALTEISIFVNHVNVGDTLHVQYKATSNRPGLELTNHTVSTNPARYSRAVYRNFQHLALTLPLGAANIFVRSGCLTLQIIGTDGKPVGDTTLKVGDTLKVSAVIGCGGSGSQTVFANWVFQGDSALHPTTATNVRIAPSLSPQNFTVRAAYWNGTDSLFSNTITVTKSFPAEVQRVSSHEWVPNMGLYSDTANSLSPYRVMKEIFGLSPVPAAGAAAQVLADSGYPGILDGYLDFLDVQFSKGINLNESSVRDIEFIGAGAVRYWKGGGRDIYGVMRLNAGGTAYRLWLKPTFKAGAQNEEILETGMKPTVTFDNAELAKLNGSVVWIGDLSGFKTDFTAPAAALADSAAPVVAAFVLNDRACQVDSVSTVTVLMSEAILLPPSISLATLASTFAFTYANATTSVNLLNGVLTSVRADGSDQPVYALNTVAGTAAEALTFEISMPSRSLFKSVQTTVTLNPAAALMERAPDPFGNAAAPAPSRVASLSGASDEGVVLCNLSSPSVVDVDDAKWYHWGTETGANGAPVEVPLFPWWGFTLVNPRLTSEGNPGGGISDTVRPENVLISITIFDLMGNLVAGPESNPTLRTVLDAVALWGNGDGKTYKKSGEVGFADIKSCQNGGGTGRCVPTWNCVNKKGRVVAPGGYIAKVAIDNGVFRFVPFTLKLVITSRK